MLPTNSDYSTTGFFKGFLLLGQPQNPFRFYLAPFFLRVYVCTRLVDVAICGLINMGVTI
jgi:hypothetical protein